jgi:hypothetical protein
MATKKQTKKRIILGTGYPWFTTVEDCEIAGPHRVGLLTEKHGGGKRVTLNLKTGAGAWKKYKLVLEEV